LHASSNTNPNEDRQSYPERACARLQSRAPLPAGTSLPVAATRRDAVEHAVMAEKHPGFEKVASGIARREGVSKERARAMLAASTRRASVKAKMKNPRLRRVK